MLADPLDSGISSLLPIYLQTEGHKEAECPREATLQCMGLVKVHKSISFMLLQACITIITSDAYNVIIYGKGTNLTCYQVVCLVCENNLHSVVLIANKLKYKKVHN